MTLQYRVVRAILHAVLFNYFHVTIHGLKNIPEGEAVYIANHHSILDSFFLVMALARKRPIMFLAKQEYFDATSVSGRLLKWLIGLSSIPVDRTNAASRHKSVEGLRAKLHEGCSIAIHPEGTRVPGGYVCRGEPGAVKIAATEGKPVVMVTIVGTTAIMPPGSRFPRRAKITMYVEKPEDVHVVSDGEARRHFHFHPGYQHTYESMTKRFMQRIAKRGGWEYIDLPAREAIHEITRRAN